MKFPIRTSNPPGQSDASGRNVRSETVAERLQAATQRHGLSEQQTRVLRLLFHEDGYRSDAAIDPSLSSDAAFLHYLETGLEKDVAPGPFFDCDFCRATMSGLLPAEPASGLLTGFVHALGGSKPSSPDAASSGPIVIAWLKSGQDKGIIPTPFFDSAYYLARYKDVVDAGVDPFLHYMEHGRGEMRIPSLKLVKLIELLSSYAGAATDPISRVVSSLPKEAAALETDGEIIVFYNKFIQPDFYEAQLPPDAVVPAGQHAARFLVEGVAHGARPSILFNEDFYRRALAERAQSENGEAQPRLGAPAKSLFMDWLYYGFPNRIVPTPLFDEQFYLARYPDLKQSRLWPFQHFVLHGLNENRLPNTLFAFDARMKTFSPTDNVGRLGLGPHFDLDRISQPTDLKTSSRLEAASELVFRKIARLRTPEMQALIAHAADIEPMVMRPGTGGIVSWPPLTHHAARASRTGALVRSSLKRNHYDTIVLIPHCRTAGSARVAGYLVRNLREVYPDESVLLVLTDGSNYEHPEWFGTDHDVFDLAAHIPTVMPHYHVPLLVDLVRGLRPKKVFNVNSLLAWNMLTGFGEQLSTEMQLFAYLFTWDLDAAGNKGGYPIQYFEAAFDYLARVLFDNHTLKDELIRRYAMSARQQDKLRVTYVPVEPPRFLFSENFALRRSQGRPLRCFWAGRFDRQKRLDVVIEIAERRPDIEIAVWGKSVIGDVPLDLSKMPKNMKLMGAYHYFEEVPLLSFDFFLYTSQWDGMPNIIVESGIVGLPIVASRVGGVGELIDDSTGWPVDDILNADAYIRAIDAMAARPDQVTQRASTLAQRTKSMFSPQQFREALASAIGSPT